MIWFITLPSSEKSVSEERVALEELTVIIQRTKALIYKDYMLKVYRKAVVNDGALNPTTFGN